MPAAGTMRLWVLDGLEGFADLSLCHGRAEILRRNKAANILDRVNVPVASHEHPDTLNG